MLACCWLLVTAGSRGGDTADRVERREISGSSRQQVTGEVRDAAGLGLCFGEMVEP